MLQAGIPETTSATSTYIREGKISIRSLPDILTMTVQLGPLTEQSWLQQLQYWPLTVPSSTGVS